MITSERLMLRLSLTLSNAGRQAKRAGGSRTRPAPISASFMHRWTMRQRCRQHGTEIVLLLLITLLSNPVAGRSQVNRRQAIDHVKLGTSELEAGNLETALVHFERAIEMDRNYGAAYFSRGLVRNR